MENEPKDYLLAKCAYMAYFHRPQIPFEDLNHSYQMKWIEVIRAVVALHDQYKRGPNKRTTGQTQTGKPFKGSEKQRAIWREQARRRREREAT